MVRTLVSCGLVVVLGCGSSSNSGGEDGGVPADVDADGPVSDASCTDGNYLSGTGCVACTVCDASTIEVGACTPTTDRVCKTAVVQLATGGFHSCALRSDGLVKCWGYNDFGQLGLGDALGRGDGPGEMGDQLPTVDLGTGRTARALALGDYFSCALLDNGAVKCWGYGDNNELGQGTFAHLGDGPNEMGDNLAPIALGTGRTAKQVSAGSSQVCALLDDDSVKCWGGNGTGEAGAGVTTNPIVAMGDSLATVALGSGRVATSVTAADGFSCAVLDDDTAKCWGDGSLGALGQGDTTTRGRTAATMGDALLAIDLGTGRKVKRLAGHMANPTACAILDDDSLKCWGYAAYGILGSGDTMTRGDQPNQMGDALPTVSLGTGRTARQVSVGPNAACALLDNGSVKCWGYNGYGQLGLGDAMMRGDQPNQMGDQLPAVSLGTGRTAISVNAGNSQACALLDNRQIKCWGSNHHGQLGQGDLVQRGDEAGQMGDALAPIDLGTDW